MQPIKAKSPISVALSGMSTLNLPLLSMRSFDAGITIKMSRMQPSTLEKLWPGPAIHAPSCFATVQSLREFMSLRSGQPCGDTMLTFPSLANVMPVRMHKTSFSFRITSSPTSFN